VKCFFVGYVLCVEVVGEFLEKGGYLVVVFGCGCGGLLCVGFDFEMKCVFS